MRPGAFRAAALAAALLALAGCETTAGFGRDLEAAGAALQREAASASRTPRTLPPSGSVAVAPLPPAR